MTDYAIFNENGRVGISFPNYNDAFTALVVRINAGDINSRVSEVCSLHEDGEAGFCGKCFMDELNRVACEKHGVYDPNIGCMQCYYMEPAQFNPYRCDGCGEIHDTDIPFWIQCGECGHVFMSRRELEETDAVWWENNDIRPDINREIHSCPICTHDF